MEVLFIVLNDLSYLDEIFKKFLELEVRGATILDSKGMARAIMDNEGLNFLLSGPFQRSLDDEQKNSKTIFTVVPEGQKAEDIVQAVRKIVEHSKKQVIGFMFTIPVSGIYTMKPKHITK
ncbi:hypothetical protein JN09_000755 [Acholeplasma morum]|uniref:P-II family nitrogen regulator n=1 Tax=Paracholeplasma morum TaxID=264637 RepID=UPI00195CC7BF|nr:hypothetical protein [Paracholeplasma morum]MBM7453429.1 hypothetical protein [Paracholeplasma morum]